MDLGERKPFDNVKYSAPRERLYKVLEYNRCHPTADMLYEILNDGKNKVSLPTVYRNLKELVKLGKVHTLETLDKKIHYDVDVSDHSHFICKECGEIIDLFEEVKTPHTLSKMGVEVEDKKCVYYGKCSKCKAKEN